MSNELFMGKNVYLVTKEEISRTGSSVSNNANTTLQICEDTISLGSIFLLSKLYIDILFLYPVSYPSVFTLYTWHFPPFILLSFLFLSFNAYFLSTCLLSTCLLNYFHLYWRIEHFLVMFFDYYSHKVQRCIL